jgi:hypothetical protein
VATGAEAFESSACPYAPEDLMRHDLTTYLNIDKEYVPFIDALWKYGSHE